jgi:hypothetical protein
MGRGGAQHPLVALMSPKRQVRTEPTSTEIYLWKSPSTHWAGKLPLRQNWPDFFACVLKSRNAGSQL